MLSACIQSNTCKRLIPSEWAGNIDDFPLLPGWYVDTRVPFRKSLEEAKGIQSTVVNCGWFMDYFLPKEKTRIAPEPDNMPVDPHTWKAMIRGSGDEPQSWTWSRDVGKAVVELLTADEWVRFPIHYCSLQNFGIDY